MPSKKADPFHWDALVRLTHWGRGGHLSRQPWLNEAGEVGTSGWDTPSWCYRHTPAVGLTRSRPRPPACPSSREPGGFSPSGRTPCANGTRPPLAITAAASWRSGHSGCWYCHRRTGWFQNTETGFGSGADDWHGVVHLGTRGMIALHLCAIAYTSWRQRSNLVTRMLPGVVPGQCWAAGTQRLERSRGPTAPVHPLRYPLDGISHRSAPLCPPAATE